MAYTYHLALIGFGNVGQGLLSILADYGNEYKNKFGVNLVVSAICTRSKGCIYHPQGINPNTFLNTFNNTGRIDSLPVDHIGWSVEKTIQDSNADIIVEISNTNFETSEPALSYIRTALEAHKHVVTTNKGPIALHYPELKKLAYDNGVELEYEGTVMCGSPVIHLGSDLLAAASIEKIEGIINGTTNFILSRMNEGIDFQTALGEAQAKGYAEADPTADIEGYDAAGKALILAKTLLGAELSFNDIKCQGISHLTTQDIFNAKEQHKTWKLIATIDKCNKGWQILVAPTLLPVSHPLAQVNGTTNAVTFTTDLLGQVTLVGPGAGKVQTGYAVILDILDIHKKKNS